MPACIHMHGAAATSSVCEDMSVPSITQDKCTITAHDHSSSINTTDTSKDTPTHTTPLVARAAFVQVWLGFCANCCSTGFAFCCCSSACTLCPNHCGSELP